MLIYQNPLYPALNLEELRRSLETQKNYERTLKNIKEMKKTPDEILRYELFIHPHQKIAIRENEYPYDLPNQLQHMLIWGDDLTPKIAKQIILEMFEITRVVCIFQQPSKKQSVKGLKHYHFFLYV